MVTYSTRGLPSLNKEINKIEKKKTQKREIVTIGVSDSFSVTNNLPTQFRVR